MVISRQLHKNFRFNPVSFEGGRSKEISRLIGRSLRSVCDLGILNGYSITVDCDVLDADGGTRTASINGAWIALNETFNNLVDQKKLVQNPLTNQIAALSVGIVDGDFIADLDYEKDYFYWWGKWGPCHSGQNNYQ